MFSNEQFPRNAESVFFNNANSLYILSRPIHAKADLSPALMARIILERFLQGPEGEMRE